MYPPAGNTRPRDYGQSLPPYSNQGVEPLNSYKREKPRRDDLGYGGEKGENPTGELNVIKPSSIPIHGEKLVPKRETPPVESKPGGEKEGGEPETKALSLRVPQSYLLANGESP